MCLASVTEQSILGTTPRYGPCHCSVPSSAPALSPCRPTHPTLEDHLPEPLVEIVGCSPLVWAEGTHRGLSAIKSCLELALVFL